jgi:transglycosylase-like protein with SLT domain
VVAVMAGGLAQQPGFLPSPAGVFAPVATHTAATFRRIVLPDLVVIDPRGLSAASLARLGKVPGFRAMLAVDGAEVTVAGHKVNALGVNGAQFRSWTPLRTASSQRLWATLDTGGFVAAPSARQALGLRPGTAYQVTGSSSVSLGFGGSAPLGVVGIDLVVSDRFSAQLGLIHDVAALVSAPGAAMPALRRAVRAAVGPGASLYDVRPRQAPLPVDGASATTRPANYLDLFRASAALYCPGLSWTVLAAIGQIESGDGTNNGPSTAGALGPMQFMPATWRVWGITAFGEQGPPNIMDAYDAVPSAARYLCAAGAATPSGLPGAIFAYNHANWYVSEVLALARQYAQRYG